MIHAETPASGRFRFRGSSENAIAASVSLLRFVQRFSRYPLDYLFVPDPEIWPAQVISWLGLLAEAVLLFFIARRVVRAFIRWRSRDATGQSPPRQSPKIIAASSKFLGAPAAPRVFGLLTALVMLWVWGGLHPPTYVHDEAAYLLQARLLATGHWKEPALPLPQFFDQMYVFTTPFHTGKYPPGFPLALVPGIWLGVPLLVPLACAGIAGGMLFSLARTITNPWTACFAWLIFTTAPRARSSPPPYMSQWLTQALWMAGFWCLLKWMEKGQFRDLVVLALAVGWCAITRPLTALAFAIPVAVAVLRRAAHRQLFRQVAVAALAGALVVGLLPLWNYEVTGNARTSPLVLNVQATTPYDQLGIGRRVAPPLHELPPDLKRETRMIGQFALHHDWVDLPTILGRRLNVFFLDWLGSRRIWLLPLIVAAAFLMPAEALFAVGVCVLDILLYLLFPHPPRFTMYYMEIQPVVAVLAAIGLFEVLALAFPEKAFPAAGQGFSRVQAAALIVLGLLLGPAFLDVQTYKRCAQANQSAKKHFRERVRELPHPAIVFVRYAPDHSPFLSLVENGADFPRQKVWFAYDLGIENLELLKIAPERHAYLFDEQANSLRPYFPGARTAATMVRAK